MAGECRACVCIILKTEIITLWGSPASALMAFKRGVIDTSNKLSNWQGDDPCGDQWSGVVCNSTNIATNVSHVTELYVFFSSTHESGLRLNLTHAFRLLTSLSICSSIAGNSYGETQTCF